VSIRVILADDQPLVRAGLRALLENEAVEVVAEAAEGGAAVQLARQHRPDVVLMDIRMRGMDGIEATRRISADPSLAGTRVIVLTTFDLDEYVFGALQAGASGFLTKDADRADLHQALRVVVAGDALLAPTATRRLVARFVESGGWVHDQRRLEELTAREREVISLVGQGLANDEIGSRLFLSPATVKTHVNRAMAKLGARDRAQIVVAAYESGLVRPGGT
jgi:DNA-binding NarL/FixJ family response regulator